MFFSALPICLPCSSSFVFGIIRHTNVMLHQEKSIPVQSKEAQDFMLQNVQQYSDKGAFSSVYC